MNVFKSIISWLLHHFQTLFLRILAQGPIPQHIAFIMDGNRRFAKKQKLEKICGHSLGWQSLEKTLSWCFRLGVRIVTVYAFSIENFKRDPDEVNYLFKMVIEKLNYLLSHSNQIDLYKLRIRILGQIDLLPSDVQQAMYEAEKLTRHNTGSFLNICIPYTSRQELSQALLHHRDCLQVPYESFLYTFPCPPVDVLIRTSGEHRLSDFLLFQCHEHSQLKFVQASWPEFSFWDVWTVMLDYQLTHSSNSSDSKRWPKELCKIDKPTSFSILDPPSFDPSFYFNCNPSNRITVSDTSNSKEE